MVSNLHHQLKVILYVHSGGLPCVWSFSAIWSSSLPGCLLLLVVTRSKVALWDCPSPMLCRFVIFFFLPVFIFGVFFWNATVLLGIIIKSNTIKKKQAYLRTNTGWEYWWRILTWGTAILLQFFSSKRRKRRLKEAGFCFFCFFFLSSCLFCFFLFLFCFSFVVRFCYISRLRFDFVLFSYLRFGFVLFFSFFVLILFCFGFIL